MLSVGCEDLTQTTDEPDPNKPSFGSNAVSDQRYVAGVPIPTLTLPQATGGDGALTYRLTPEVPGLTFSEDSRTLSGMPSAVASHEMQYEARDSDGDTATLTFRIVAEPLTTLYWAGTGGFERASLDGRNRQTLSEARDVANSVAVTQEHLYWTTISVSGVVVGSTIHRADRDGGNAVELRTTSGTAIVDITVDVARGTLYWTELAGFVATGMTGKLRRANLDGTGVQDVVTRADTFIASVAVDATGGKLYWTEADVTEGGRLAADKIRRSNLDGTNMETLLMQSGLVPAFPAGISPHGLEIADGKMYFVAGKNGQAIARANLDGTGLEAFAQFSSESAWNIALDAEDGKIYWTTIVISATAPDSPDSDQEVVQPVRIQRANLDGSHVEEIMAATDRAFVGIVMDGIGRKIIWTEASGESGLPLGGESTSRVRQANRDGSAVQDLVVDTTVVHAPGAFAVDVLDKKLYWAEAGAREVLIRRANLDGSATVNLVRQTSLASAQIRGFALDVVDGKMYWAVEESRPGASASFIRRANLDGTGDEVLPITVELLRAIALDVLAGKIYWADGRTIRQANLDGTDQKDLSVDAWNADALAIDLVGGKIYWSNYDGVYRANLDGTEKEDLSTLPRADALAVDSVGAKLYYWYYSYDSSPWEAIGRANLDGSGKMDRVRLF